MISRAVYGSPAERGNFFFLTIKLHIDELQMFKYEYRKMIFIISCLYRLSNIWLPPLKQGGYNSRVAY